jgi:hypothetical protein
MSVKTYNYIRDQIMEMGQEILAQYAYWNFSNKLDRDNALCEHFYAWFSEMFSMDDKIQVLMFDVIRLLDWADLGDYLDICAEDAGLYNPAYADLHNPEADEISDEDLRAAADLYDRLKPMHPNTYIEYFPPTKEDVGPHCGLKVGDKIKLINYGGGEYRKLTNVKVDGFALDGLYCWFTATDIEERRQVLRLAFCVRGEFTYRSQKCKLVKKEQG